jgi:hypothetical protein
VKRPGGSAGPYPGVVERIRADGSKYYKAQHVRRRRDGSGKSVCVVLGTWDDPQRAYYALLDRRATVAEHRAAELRADADAVLHGLVRKKPGRPRKALAQ